MGDSRTRIIREARETLREALEDVDNLVFEANEDGDFDVENDLAAVSEAIQDYLRVEGKFPEKYDND